MAKIRSSNKKKNGLIELKIVAKKLQKSFSMGKKSNNSYEEINDDSTWVPKDVKEGHFPLIADGEEPKRFVVPLRYLTHPKFLRLLEQAAEEYGFDHEGALTIPCQPRELQRILEEQWEEKDHEANVDDNWSSTLHCCKAVEKRENRSWSFWYHF